jgi:hypothetical protein
MTHIAVHDALNASTDASGPYAVSLHGYARASVPATVAAAARGVLVPGLTELSTFLPPQCVAAGVASVEADYATALAAIPDGPARSAGIRLGERAAAAVRALRADDGSDTLIQDPNYPQGHPTRRVPVHARDPVRVSPPAGETSRRSRCATAHSSGPDRPTR